MRIKTEILKEMISKAVKGAGMNKMLPITNLIGIQFKEDSIGNAGTLTLMTKDGYNDLLISNEVEGKGDFYTIVNVETFSKLIGKTTKEFIELENEDNYLKVKGNGEYKLQLPINEEGEIVKFPKKDLSIFNQNSEEIPIQKIKSALNSGKVCVAKTMEFPCITGYYISDKLLTTNRQMVCFVDERMVDNNILLSESTSELLQLFEDEVVKLSRNDKNELLFSSNNIKLIAKELEDKEQYPVQLIENLLNTKYDFCIKVNKQELLNVLDRMSLFITEYDEGGIYLNISENGLQIRSQQSDATEIISITSNEIGNDFECLVDIEMIKSQVQTMASDAVEIYYGQKSSIKLKEGNTTMVLSLVQKAN